MYFKIRIHMKSAKRKNKKNGLNRSALKERKSIQSAIDFYPRQRFQTIRQILRYPAARTPEKK
ncbi:MAG: hypothetical protein CVV44_05695 [Spirochaetae bacterium HGW-Spirochaetae-1]|nr:MAG: hypothetical protein CVV44_05695 [Spirochaetae bacterium HGW-Spirochaetae-1]